MPTEQRGDQEGIELSKKQQVTIESDQNEAEFIAASPPMSQRLIDRLNCCTSGNRGSRIKTRFGRKRRTFELEKQSDLEDNIMIQILTDKRQRKKIN